MDITTSVEGDKAFVTARGKLTVGTSPDLSAAVDALPSNVSNIDIDMTDVDYVASAGLRVLVATEKLAKNRGGDMRLINPCREVMDVLDMTGLIDVLTVVQS